MTPSTTTAKLAILQWCAAVLQEAVSKFSPKIFKHPLTFSKLLKFSKRKMAAWLIYVAARLH
jgi:hypothetical protein